MLKLNSLRQQEVFLTSRVSHVVRDRPAGGAGVADAGGAGVAARARAGGSPWVRREWRARADAMLECVRRAQLTHTQASQHRYILLTVQKAINLLDNLYDTFFASSRKAHVTIFTKHFIKIEFLDKLCRPVYKEFDEWPEISLEPDSSKENKKETPEDITNTAAQKMTRKSRPRNKDREEKEPKGGYCEMCNTDYVDAALHRRSPHHLAFVRDRTNFLALDSLIGTGNDVTTFLDKATSINGERRSQRKMCNGDIEQPKNKRSKGPQSPDSTVNGNLSPRRNGGLDDERKHNTRCSKKVSETQVEDRQYYKVVGVSTKLRSSGGFANKRKDSPPVVNGTKPLVVKFRKVRRSELSVLSDEAEQFMFPKRASSTSSTSSDDDKEIIAKLKSTLQTTPNTNERRRQARPLTLKEESSEGESAPEDKRKRKRRVGPVAKRTRRVTCKPKLVRKADIKELPVDTKTEEVEQVPAVTVSPNVTEAVSSSRDEPPEGCMKWEDGKLKYTAAVEQLEFAFESVPRSEPWFETFKRQDEDKAFISNVPQYFTLYSKSPKLPYEIGQLPPLKANCCPLSDLVKRDEKPGPSRSYGTRGMKNQKIRKRTAAVIALEGHPRKSPREHASTLAILGSAGLLHRRKHIDDSKSTASEDTVSDAHSNMKIEPVPSETQEASERLQQFLSEVFDDAAEYEVSEDAMDGDVTFTTSTYVPDVSSLVSECENCDLITKEIKAATDRPRGKRGKFKKRNRTGWPKKRRQKKSSRDSTESEQKVVESSLDRSSAEPLDDDTTQDTMSEEDTNQSEIEKDETTIERSEDKTLTEVMSESSQDKSVDSDEKTLINISKVQKMSPEKSKKVEEKEEKSRCSDSEDKEDRELRRNKRMLHGLGEWLQPVVRVARVDPAAARRLRSAARPRTPRVR